MFSVLANMKNENKKNIEYVVNRLSSLISYKRKNI